MSRLGCSQIPGEKVSRKIKAADAHRPPHNSQLSDISIGKSIRRNPAWLTLPSRDACHHNGVCIQVSGNGSFIFKIFS